MSFISSVRTLYLAWSQSTPLPILLDASATFQSWHTFNEDNGKWTRLHVQAPAEQNEPGLGTQHGKFTSREPLPQTLTLATWNVDGFGKHPEARTDGILSALQSLDHVPDVVLFQEVPHKALIYLLSNARVREGWILSEADDTNWAGVQFATLTMLSRARFKSFTSPGTLASAPCNPFSAGPVWRVKYPTRFKRDALCCDVFYHNTRIRLVNVHLDSLPIQPNQRPRQVEITASLIKHAGVDCGLVAGDFNPVSEEDASLVSENGLVDVWEMINPAEDGFTWGLEGSGEPFPPGRFDKVAVLGLRPKRIDVIHPGFVSEVEEPDERGPSESEDQHGALLGEHSLPWSDHSGLLASLDLINLRQ
ncbi:hypothetical protein N8I77_012119 [Diaporthe amygdali]|uniref:Endonuclease/exonuclease/phosphatase domain-containing protein n=1 Tax=Phomopsis amygdali TaxID=1214568 RepID=A0AAD9S5J7_PHOAM|nr:hypothetical protein N8I77_012119 [Diaporthe amygdali]